MGKAYSVIADEITEGEDIGLYMITSVYSESTTYGYDENGNLDATNELGTEMVESSTIDNYIGDGKNVFYKIINYNELEEAKNSLLNLIADGDIHGSDMSDNVPSNINSFKVEAVFKSIYRDLNDQNVGYIKKHRESNGKEFVLHDPIFISNLLWCRCINKYNPKHNNVEDINFDAFHNELPDGFPYINYDQEPNYYKLIIIYIDIYYYNNYT